MADYSVGFLLSAECVSNIADVLERNTLPLLRPKFRVFREHPKFWSQEGWGMEKSVFRRTKAVIFLELIVTIVHNCPQISK